MAKTLFECKDCKEQKEVPFELGKKPEPPVCPKCGKSMTRIFKNISLGDTQGKDMIDLSQRMLYS